MTTGALVNSNAIQSGVQDPRMLVLHRDILLATDASPSAAAATRVAAALAERWHVTPRACTVTPPPSIIYDSTGGAAVYVPDRHDFQLGVGRQLADANLSLGWVHQMSSGIPADEIIRAVQLCGSDLVVLGLRPHTLLDRVFRDETALSVMRHASVPVLGVTPSLTSIPRRIAVAIDFSRASMSAARAALQLLDGDGALYLVHVEAADDVGPPETEGFRAIYAEGLAAAFQRLRSELGARTAARIETVVLHGNVVPALLSFARRAEIDVVAIGSQRHSVAHCAFVGSTTTALVRAGQCSLLVIPPGRNPVVSS
jgi:nucleotide-binding universal stress UspA family protein